MKPLIVITRKIPEEGIDKLLHNERLEFRVHQSATPLGKQKITSFVKNANAIVSILDDKIDEEVIKSAGPELKIIANYAVGFDNIDLKAATKHNVAVTNTPDSSSRAVAEFTMTVMLNLAKHIEEGDKFTERGKYKFWDPNLLLGHELGGTTMGIIGCGKIGTMAAQMCYYGLGMKILYADIVKNEGLERSTHAYHTSINRLLESADFVSLHVPLLPSTRHLINAHTIKKMKPSAYLVNTSRGPVVDEKELISALKNKTIAGAALDVYEHEPKIASELTKLPNVITTPHIASATHEARKIMGRMVAENILYALKGERPPGLVNTEIEHIYK